MIKNKSDKSLGLHVKSSRKPRPIQINRRESEDEVTNVNVELHPIGYYIDDREEMINQMFSILKPGKLRAMLPPILKRLSIEELKLYCLDELLGMSWKRINSILEGWELQTSSESEGDEDINYPGSSQDIDRPMLEIGIANKEIEELLNCVASNKKGQHKRLSEILEPSTSCSKKYKCESKKVLANENVQKDTKKDTKCIRRIYPFDNKLDASMGKNDSEAEGRPNTENKGKTLLEILELQMRARAIRALLKQCPGESRDENGNNEESADI